MQVKTFTLTNDAKVERALNGTPINNSETSGGIGNGAYFEDGVWKREGKDLSEADVDKLESALLAEYDKLGGLIKRGGDKVKTGSFYDFKAKKAHIKPIVSFLYRVNGREIDVPDGVELPGAVKAQKILEDEAEKEQEPQGEVQETKGKKGKKVREE